MDEIKQMIPKRRFKEFQNDEAWEQRKLGELADIVRGASPRPIKDPKWFDDKSEVGWLRISDVTEQDGRITFLSQRISKAGQEKTRVLFEPHLLLSIAATVGKSVINYVDTGVHDGFLIFLNPKFNQEFMFQWFEMFRPKWQQFGQPGSQVNLNSDLVKNTPIMLPKEDEQEKIGNFLKSIDNLITLHQRKLEKIKSMKKAYLYEMFPAEGEDRPKRRFKGFTEAWEQCKFKDIAEFNPKSEIPESFEYVDLESVVGTEMITHRAVNKSNAPSRAQRLAKQGDLFYQTVRPYQKNNYLYDKAYDNYVFSTGYAQIRPKVEGHFLLSYVQTNSFVDEIMSRCTGTSYPAISSSDMEDMIISVPKDKDEQIKISKFLMGIDNLITLHQRKLEKLNNLKKAYLNEMFV